MIETRKIEACRECGSTKITKFGSGQKRTGRVEWRNNRNTKITKNGHQSNAKQKYQCSTCADHGTLGVEPKYSEARKAEILRAYHERSMWGISRTFGVSRPTLAKWLREAAAALPDSPPVVAAEERDVFELDEVWSLVGSKKHKMGVWCPLSAYASDHFVLV